MDWQAIGSGILTAAIGLPVIGYGILRKLRHDMASDGASDDARKILKNSIEHLKEELKDQRQRDRDKFTDLLNEYTEFRQKAEREFGFVQKFNRETASDIRKLARAGSVAEQDLDTQIYDTGMGPLDR